MPCCKASVMRVDGSMAFDERSVAIYAMRSSGGRLRACANFACTCAITLSQSPNAGWRNRRAVGYQGVSARSSIQRQSDANGSRMRSEEHTSELQSHLNIVCRLLLE